MISIRTFLWSAIIVFLCIPSSDTLNLRTSTDNAEDFMKYQKTGGIKEIVNNLFSEVVSVLHNSSSNRVNLTLSLLDAVIRNHGASISQLYNNILSADKNATRIIEIINDSFHYNILKIVDTNIKFDFVQLISLIRNSAKQALKCLFPGNYILQIVVQYEINNQINLHYLDWKNEVEKKSVPSTVFEVFFPILNKINHRQRRDSLQDSEVIQSLLDIVLNLLKAELSGILVTVKNSLHEIFDNLTTFLLSFYTSAKPVGFFQDILAHLKNTFIQRSVELINFLDQTLDKLFLSLVEFHGASPRKRRNISDHTAISYSENHISFLSIIIAPLRLIVNIIVAVFKTLVNIVLHPLQTISSFFYFILSLLSTIAKTITSIARVLVSGILGPLNCALKQVVVKMFYRLKEFLSSLLLDPVRQSIFNLIDSIIPCYSKCTLNNLQVASIQALNSLKQS